MKKTILITIILTLLMVSQATAFLGFLTPFETLSSKYQCGAMTNEYVVPKGGTVSLECDDCVYDLYTASAINPNQFGPLTRSEVKADKFLQEYVGIIEREVYGADYYIVQEFSGCNFDNGDKTLCYDSDLLDGRKKGTVFYHNDKTASDYCLGDNFVVEMYCETKTEVKSTTAKVPSDSKCEDGKAVKLSTFEEKVVCGFESNKDTYRTYTCIERINNCKDGEDKYTQYGTQRSSDGLTTLNMEECWNYQDNFEADHGSEGVKEILNEECVHRSFWRDAITGNLFERDTCGNDKLIEEYKEAGYEDSIITIKDLNNENFERELQENVEDQSLTITDKILIICVILVLILGVARYFGWL